MPPRRIGHLIAAITLAGASATSCGDPAADSTFEGDPLDSVACGVVLGPGAKLEDRHLRTVFVWLLDEHGTTFVQQPAASLKTTESFPDGTRVDLLDPPPDEAVRPWPGVTGAFALGQPVVIDDIDGDGAWTPKVDTVMGVADDTLVLYTVSGVSGTALPESYGPGFHHVRPAECGTTPSIAGPAPDTCALTISKADGLPFAFICEKYYECAPVEEMRFFCRMSPDAELCDRCAAVVFPLGASDDDCDAWLPGCKEMAPAAQCDAELQVCREGEPACDMPCLCQKNYDICLRYADAATCRPKYTGEGSVCVEAGWSPPE